jgi:hypothetical protein
MFSLSCLPRYEKTLLSVLLRHSVHVSLLRYRFDDLTCAREEETEITEEVRSRSLVAMQKMEESQDPVIRNSVGLPFTRQAQPHS